MSNDPVPVTKYTDLINQVFTAGYKANGGKIDLEIASSGGADWTPEHPIKGIDITTGGKLSFVLANGSQQDRVVPDNEKIRGYVIITIKKLSGTDDASDIYPLV